MPDLEQLIAGWRADLLRAMPHRKDAVLELEEHLRDQIADLVQSGMTPDVAFAAAVKRIGEAPALAGEFSRALGPERERSWPVICVYGVLGLAFAALILLAAIPTYIGARPLLMGVIFSTVSAGYISVFAMGALSFCVLLTFARGSLSERKRAVSRRAIARLALTGAVLLAIGIFANQALAKENHDRVWESSSIAKGPLLALFALGILLATQIRSTLRERYRWALAGLGIVVFALGLIDDLRLEPIIFLPFVWLLFSSFALGQIAVVHLRPPPSYPMRPA